MKHVQTIGANVQDTPQNTCVQVDLDWDGGWITNKQQILFSGSCECEAWVRLLSVGSKGRLRTKCCHGPNAARLWSNTQSEPEASIADTSASY